MRVWRVAAETRRYSADDLSGNGSASYPGRWNEEEQRVLYCAASMSLAVLETVAHLDDDALPQNRFLVAIDLPDEAWSRRTVVDVEQLKVGWDAIPAGLSSVTLGSKWLRSKRSALLLVPSSIVPEEQLVLLNPAHAHASKATATKLRKFEYHHVRRSAADQKK